MRRRLLLFGLLAVLAQASSGCFHIARCAVARFRANHPCLTCAPAFRVPPPVAVGGPVVAPVVGVPPGDCPGCGHGGPIEGYPVGFVPPGPGPIPVGAVGGVPGITGPYPLHNPTIEGTGAAVPGAMPPGKDGKAN